MIDQIISIAAEFYPYAIVISARMADAITISSIKNWFKSSSKEESDTTANQNIPHQQKVSRSFNMRMDQLIRENPKKVTLLLFALIVLIIAILFMKRPPQVITQAINQIYL